jgi:hypothetical protein
MKTKTMTVEFKSLEDLESDSHSDRQFLKNSVKYKKSKLPY